MLGLDDGAERHDVVVVLVHRAGLRQTGRSLHRLRLRVVAGPRAARLRGAAEIRARVVRVLVAEPEGVTELVRDHDLRRAAVRDQIDAPVVSRVAGRAGLGLDVLDHPGCDVREPARGELCLDVVGPLLRERLVVLVGARPRGVRFDGDVRRAASPGCRERSR